MLGWKLNSNELKSKQLGEKYRLCADISSKKFGYEREQRNREQEKRVKKYCLKMGDGGQSLDASRNNSVQKQRLMI